MFEDSLDRMFAETITPELVSTVEREAWSDELWMAIAENGIPIAAVPEDMDGVGATWSECFDIPFVLGRHSVPLPAGETMAAGWLAAREGKALPEGPASLGVTDGNLSASGFTGTVRGVPWGRKVDNVLACCGRRLMLLPVERASIEKSTNVAGEPRDNLHFSSISPVWAVEPASSQDCVLLAGAMLRAAQIAGALDKAREMTIGYVTEREQFGRPIAKFQAVQHQVAQLAEHAVIATSVAAAAFAQAESEAGAFAIAAAKQVCSEAAGQGAAIAHAMVGALGFSQEYPLQLLTRRLWSWRSEFGNAAFWADRIGQASCSEPGEQLWSRMIAGDLAPAMEV